MLNMTFECRQNCADAYRGRRTPLRRRAYTRRDRPTSYTCAARWKRKQPAQRVAGAVPDVYKLAFSNAGSTHHPCTYTHAYARTRSLESERDCALYCGRLLTNLALGCFGRGMTAPQMLSAASVVNTFPYGLLVYQCFGSHAAPGAQAVSQNSQWGVLVLDPVQDVSVFHPPVSSLYVHVFSTNFLQRLAPCFHVNDLPEAGLEKPFVCVEGDRVVG